MPVHCRLILGCGTPPETRVGNGTEPRFRKPLSPPTGTVLKFPTAGSSHPSVERVSPPKGTAKVTRLVDTEPPVYQSLFGHENHRAAASAAVTGILFLENQPKSYRRY